MSLIAGSFGEHVQRAFASHDHHVLDPVLRVNRVLRMPLPADPVV